MLQRTLPAGFIAPCLPNQDRNPRRPQADWKFILYLNVEDADRRPWSIPCAQGATMTDVETALANSGAHNSNQYRAVCKRALRRCLISYRASFLSWACRFSLEKCAPSHSGGANQTRRMS